jgi:catechol 2,3-dioxygenase-like lactoylglutathione lyase family enzyme
VSLFAEVGLRASDLEATRAFLAAVMPVLGVEETRGADGAVRFGDLALRRADGAHPPTRGLHVGLWAPAHEEVDAFWRAGTAAGHPDDGAPGPRTIYAPEYYGGFLLDPDGNSIEAMYLDSPRTRGQVDHLWIRVPDLAAARARYAGEVAPAAGLEVRDLEATDALPPRVMLRGDGGSFTLLEGEPTEHLELTLSGPAGDPVRVLPQNAPQAA